MEDAVINTSPASEEARTRFLDAAREVRPKLHRFCTRMSGSVLDGEDLVQETLASAFHSLSSLTDQTRLEPWLFRIAHRRCVDFLRRERTGREATVPYTEEHDVVRDEEGGEPLDEALAALVGVLPPKERASVLLKDVLDYRLAEIAEVVDSTVGGVKAALHRGRAKLRTTRERPPPRVLDREQRRLLEAYAECFTRRDWDALLRLIEVDARLQIVGVTEQVMPAAGTLYFGNYAALRSEGRMAVARVGGEPVLVYYQREDTGWHPRSAVRLRWNEGKIVSIRDYYHVEYLFDGVSIEPLEDV